ncbi:SafA/ExsA family spore coat assembly protein [Sporosarcina luteola]|uniref:LysM peptidoglycan-binding domain-containing protein n=1 Tax=Sporosarcina luteola TaxID=582850 RepID=UPI0020409DC7|nr:SafA/ExsA family spore coat assembly protein [Sporosarcina luteola]
MDVHIVVKGDTLWKIARQYGISFDELKRVNAHLANPDYIVPGMKIFLPKKKAGHMPTEKGKEKMHEKVKQHHQAPTQPHEKPSKPEEKIPLPKEKTEFEMPMPPSVPKQPMPTAPVQKPPAAMTPPAESPMMQPLPPVPSLPPMPPPVPMPPMQMPQFFQPCMPVPCGWMPIYDADCAPMAFPSFTQQIPAAPVMPQQVMPSQELPMPPARLGVKPPSIEMTEELEEFDESPIYPGRGAGAPPTYPITGWELMESPMMPEEMMESPMMTEESPEQEVYCPPEQGYVPQMVSPEFQNPYGMMQPPQQPFAFGYPCPPMHQPMHHCGCSCHSQGFYGMSPSEMQPNYMMPMQVSPMQMQPAQMYPVQMNPMPMMQPPMNPMQMNPMQMNPMQMPINPMDNYGCGC